MKDIYIALGANLSNPKETFIKALDELSTCGLAITKVSGLWQSPSWPPGLGHPDYLNAVAKVEYLGTPSELLTVLNTVEASFGRERQERNAPRPLDLDIIAFGELVLSGKNLTIPHARMFTRGFVLFPLEEIGPEWCDPRNGNKISGYIAQLPLRDVAPMKYIGTFYQCN